MWIKIRNLETNHHDQHENQYNFIASHSRNQEVVQLSWCTSERIVEMEQKCLCIFPHDVFLWTHWITYRQSSIVLTVDLDQCSFWKQKFSDVFPNETFSFVSLSGILTCAWRGIQRYFLLISSLMGLVMDRPLIPHTSTPEKCMVRFISISANPVSLFDVHLFSYVMSVWQSQINEWMYFLL